MSAPRYIRQAIEACRPIKSSTIRTQFVSIGVRRYASSTRDITEGFPTVTEDGQSTREDVNSRKQLLETMSNAPPKRTPRPIAGSESLTSKNPAQLSEDATSRSTGQSPSDKSSSPKSIIEEISNVLASQEDTPQQQQPISTTPVPPNVLAAYHTPLKHPAPHGVPVASLQLRSYSVRNLEFFADFALRAAFYLNLPATGPVPLPKIIERWTMPRSNFVHKKSQENFERITRRRLITIKDGNTSVVEVWLAFLRKWQFYGVGMKANVWQWESLDVGSKIDEQFASTELEKELDAKLANFGFNRTASRSRSLQRMMEQQGMNRVGVAMTQLRDASRTAEKAI